MGFIAAYRSEFSHFIPQIHLLFSSSVRHCICNSFLSPSLIQPFISACHSKYLSHPKPSFQMIIPLSFCTRFQSGFERSDRHAEWESVAKEPEDSISNRNTCACTQTHLHHAFIIFCYSNKANATKVLMMSLMMYKLTFSPHKLIKNSDQP